MVLLTAPMVQTRRPSAVLLVSLSQVLGGGGGSEFFIDDPECT